MVSLPDRIEARRQEAREDSRGGFGALFQRGVGEATAELDEMVDYERWYQDVKRRMLALVTDEGGTQTSYNPHTGEHHILSHRPHVKELVLQIEAQYGDVRRTCLLVLRMALLRGEYVEGENAETLRKMDLVYRPPEPKKRGILR